VGQTVSASRRSVRKSVVVMKKRQTWDSSKYSLPSSKLTQQELGEQELGATVRRVSIECWSTIDDHLCWPRQPLRQIVANHLCYHPSILYSYRRYTGSQR
jgi:hypothetical protein